MIHTSVTDNTSGEPHSSSEGRPSAPRFGRSASPSLSFVDAVLGKGKAP
jgi:hypothetical protein